MHCISSIQYQMFHISLSNMVKTSNEKHEMDSYTSKDPLQNVCMYVCMDECNCIFHSCIDLLPRWPTDCTLWHTCKVLQITFKTREATFVKTLKHLTTSEASSWNELERLLYLHGGNFKWPMTSTFVSRRLFRWGSVWYHVSSGKCRIKGADGEQISNEYQRWTLHLSLYM